MSLFRGRRRSRSTAENAGDTVLLCSFCGKSQDGVRKLIAGPTVYICDECIDLCNDIIAEECEQEEALGQKETPAQVSARGISIWCPVCRIPKDVAELLTIAENRFVCRACADAIRSALDGEPET